jgi:hypothetical protein
MEMLEGRVLLDSGDFLDTGPYIQDSLLHEPVAVAQPALGESYTDPVFGTKVWRVSQTRPPSGGKSYAGTVPEYSKAQAWNCDCTRLLLRGTDGYWWLYDGQTLTGRKKANIPGGDLEPRWLKNDPDRFVYLVDDKVCSYNARTAKSSVVAQFKGMGQLSSGAEQELPNNDRYLVVHGTINYDRNNNFLSTKAWVVDLDLKKRAGAIKVFTHPENSPVNRNDWLDSLAITPDGKYITAMWADHGVDLYTRGWKFVRRLTRWSEHGDFAQYAPGKWALVIAHYRGDSRHNNPGDPALNDETIELIPLDGSKRRVLWKAPVFNMGIHISARNTKLPGWVFVSTYWDGRGQRPGPTPFENEVLALSLSSTLGNPQVRRLAHTYMTERYDYWDEPHATVRQDGKMILFASNFDHYRADENYVDTYAIDLR